MLKGYQQSLRPTQSGLTLNIDVCATAFLEVQPVRDYLGNAGVLTDWKSPLNPANLLKAKKAIRSVKV